MSRHPALEAVSSNGMNWLTDHHARENGLLVAFSSRLGGVSAPPFDSLNLAARGGDDPSNVAENRRRVAAALGFADTSLALARQVHGTRLLEARAGQSGVLGEADILATPQAGPVLAILTADCAPVLIAGEGGIAIAHAGWRGLVAGVVEKAVEAIAPVTSAWVGPCIHACCYPVGAEVTEAFRSAGLPVEASGCVDPAQASTFALQRAGVDRIAVADACTACDRNYFSYRRDGVTGRQGAFFALLDL